MANNIKQIYVSLQLCENEIKILVGEYFNTRFNIIRSEKYPTSSISDFKIINREELIKDIRNAVKDCSDKIGSQIEQVILVLPAYNFKRYPLHSNVIPENGIVRREDIARAVSMGICKVNVGTDIRATYLRTVSEYGKNWDGKNDIRGYITCLRDKIKKVAKYYMVSYS